MGNQSAVRKESRSMGHKNYPQAEYHVKYFEP